jgi:hypothetical protein
VRCCHGLLSQKCPSLTATSIIPPGFLLFPFLHCHPISLVTSWPPTQHQNHMSDGPPKLPYHDDSSSILIDGKLHSLVPNCPKIVQFKKTKYPHKEWW